MAIVELTLPVRRRDALRVARRDVVLLAGEALEIRLSLVEADVPEAVPLSFANGVPAVRLAVFGDGPCPAAYGAAGADAPALVWQGWGTAIPGQDAAMRLLVPEAATAGWRGRYGFAVQLARDGGAVALLRGTLLVRLGLPMPPVGLDPLQDDAGAPVLDDATLAIQVPHAPIG